MWMAKAGAKAGAGNGAWPSQEKTETLPMQGFHMDGLFWRDSSERGERIEPQILPCILTCFRIDAKLGNPIPCVFFGLA